MDVFQLRLFLLFSRQKIELPSMENVQTIPPPYVVRTVLIYSRHAGQLQFNPSEAVGVSMTRLTHCFFIYVHFSILKDLGFFFVFLDAFISVTVL